MGLDMYFTAQKKLWPMPKEDCEDRKKCNSIRELFPEIKTDESSNIEVAFDIGYWRKANHIHKWFVDNVQNGQDDQEKHYVDDDELKMLLILCKKVLDNHDLAEKLLPTQGGFFFGCTEYSDYYFECIESTIKVVENALALDGKYYLKYQASW